MRTTALNKPTLALIASSSDNLSFANNQFAVAKGVGHLEIDYRVVIGKACHVGSNPDRAFHRGEVAD
jgi:hypothetical protein